MIDPLAILGAEAAPVPASVLELLVQTRQILDRLTEIAPKLAEALLEMQLDELASAELDIEVAIAGIDRFSDEHLERRTRRVSEHLKHPVYRAQRRLIAENLTAAVAARAELLGTTAGAVHQQALQSAIWLGTTEHQRTGRSLRQAISDAYVSDLLGPDALEETRRRAGKLQRPRVLSVDELAERGHELPGTPVALGRAGTDGIRRGHAAWVPPAAPAVPLTGELEILLAHTVLTKRQREVVERYLETHKKPRAAESVLFARAIERFQDTARRLRLYPPRP